MTSTLTARFPYQRLWHGGVSEEEAEEERGFGRRRNFSRFMGFRKRPKVRIPGLKRWLRKRRRLLSRVKLSYSKALKRLKKGQAHMNNLVGGNYLVMQLPM